MYGRIQPIIATLASGAMFMGFALLLRPTPGGKISVQDVARGETVATTEGAFGPIDPGKTVKVGPMPLTVSSYYNEEHTLVLKVDPNNSIPETNEDDNRGEKKYTLKKGDC